MAEKEYNQLERHRPASRCCEVVNNRLIVGSYIYCVDTRVYDFFVTTCTYVHCQSIVHVTTNNWQAAVSEAVDLDRRCYCRSARD